MAVLLTYLVLAHLLLSLAATGAAKVPAVIVFGDSSVDAGNNNGISTVLKSNFAPYGRDFYGGRATGRFSNGRVPSDFISEAFGLRPFVPAYLDPMKISLAGLPPMGCLPLERATNFLGGNGDTCTETYNNVALAFNGKMAGLVAKLNEELPGAKVVFSNPYFIFQQIIRRPSLYGFDVSSVACCATGMFEMGYMCNRYTAFTCTDASKYVFWDAFHPTEKTNRIISDHLVKNVLSGFV
ncbi:hypothetical protein RHMOL_Rhmol06G0234600 [Rhododendron molle]|uniref:Uncharacterized protein n=1 Tax=Rhododendron molle TaxID=49168 RepID=A0ACC0NGY3_RHOML|nr:hypothetical protein RHMOL_Rhmol06G0234600 [Rhododendron molle]